MKKNLKVTKVLVRLELGTDSSRTLREIQCWARRVNTWATKFPYISHVENNISGYFFLAPWCPQWEHQIMLECSSSTYDFCYGHQIMRLQTFLLKPSSKANLTARLAAMASVASTEEGKPIFYKRVAIARPLQSRTTTTTTNPIPSSTEFLNTAPS